MNSVQLLARANMIDKGSKEDQSDWDEFDAMESGSLSTLHDVVFDVIKTGVQSTAQLMDIEGLMQYRDQNGHCVLTIAARTGNLEVVKYLVKSRGMSPMAATAKDGSNALHWSVIKGHLDVTYWLLNNGADPYVADGVGNNLAHYSACCGMIEMVKYLAKDRHMDMRIVNKKGRDARGWAKEKNRFKIMQFLLEFAEGVDEVICEDVEDEGYPSSESSGDGYETDE